MNQVPENDNVSLRLRNIKRFSILILFMNLLLGVVKWLIGSVVGSIAILADAVQTFMDGLTTFLVYWGAKIAGKPADSEHPFGHGRAEFLSGFAIAVILAIVGIEFLFKSFVKVIKPAHIHIPLWAVVAIALSGLFKDLMAWLSLKVGRNLESPGLVSDAHHHKMDAWTSYGIALGLLAQNRFDRMDGLLGVGVSLYILYVAYRLIKETGSPLLGEPVSENIKELVQEAVRETPGVIKVRSIEIHRYGDHTEIVLKAEMDPDIPLQKAHELATILEREVEKRINGRVTVHPEPATH